MLGRVTCSFWFPGCEDMKEVTEKKETVRENDITPPESTSVRKEVTQEELEDWLDSMIS